MRIQRETDGATILPFHDLPLSEADKAILGGLVFVRKTCPPHTDLATDGDDRDRTFLVGKGWTVLYRILANGERHILDFPVSGDLISLSGSRHGVQLSFMAITEATVYEINTPSLIAAAANLKGLVELLFAETARHSAILVEHMVNLGRRSALSRVAHLLLEMGVRLNMAGLGQPDDYECPLTQYDLADALGLTAIHVNRMLRELRRSDLLHFHKNSVGLLDRKMLATLAGFDPTYLRRDSAQNNELGRR